MNLWDQVVLCSTFLGGAEIYSLERMRADAQEAVLHCNPSLAAVVRGDSRYDTIEVATYPCLEPLAKRISWGTMRAASRGMSTLLRQRSTLLGNLRAASIQLVAPSARENCAFIHDNANYLNFKARLLITLIVARSRTVFFPCLHSAERVPLKDP